MSDLIASGVSPLDERLGGLVPRRTYLLCGSPGAGTSVACLEFLNGALERGESAAILTHDDPQDVIAQAAFLGLDLDRPLREEQFVLIRYQLDFVRRFSRQLSTDVAFDELRRLLGTRTHSRLAIDSIAPFLEAGAAAGAGIAGVMRFLDEYGATTMVTYPGDLSAVYDRRLEPLLQRAAAIVQFVPEGDRAGRIEIRKVRFPAASTASIQFRIAPGVGFVAAADGMRRRASDARSEGPARVLFLTLADDAPAELVAPLQRTYDLAVRRGIATAFHDLASDRTDAILIDVRRETLDDALSLVRQLRSAGGLAPVALVSRFAMRWHDRARALRAGADEFMAGDFHPEEVRMRVESLLRRGHHAAPLPAEREEEETAVVRQPTGGGALPTPLDEDGFRRVLRVHMAEDRLPLFTVVSARPAGGDTGRLSEVALRCVRVDSGDLVGVVDGRVAIYLHSARRKDVTRFVERLRERWHHTAQDELELDVASYPTDDAKVTSMFGAA
jgi:KaiC/GvpD/RAD55 family RecA-like ATPase